MRCKLGRCAGLVCGAILLVVCGVARADWTLTTADFVSQGKLTVNEWSLQEGLSVSPETGTLQTIATRQVVNLVSDQAKVASDAKWRLVLRNGDVLQGAPVGMHGAAIQFKVTELGTIEAPLRAVAALETSDVQTPPARAVDKDVVLMRNGDTLEGVFLGMTDGKLQMQSDLGTSAVDLDAVTRLSLGGAAPARGVPELSVRVTFLSGSVLTSKTLRWTVHDVLLTDPAGQERKCAADQILSVEVLGGRVVWLTELDPAKDEQVSTFGSKWPTAINRNVMGGPLMLNKTTYDRGLGVHTQSVLTYDLKGAFATLTLRCGVDDSAQPYGEANLSVVLDGKVLWEGKGMKAGQISAALSLDVKGGKTLELRAEPGSRMDVEGRVDWVRVALIRP